MTLDEANARLIDAVAQSAQPPLEQISIEETRKLVAEGAAAVGQGPEMALVSDVRIPVDGATIDARLLVPVESPAGAILYLHGGGWVSGGIDETDALARHIARRTRCAVLLPAYRLAPEYRFPTAVEDAWRSLLWMDGRLEEIAGRRVPLIVAGDSAGGNLAAVAALRARDHRGPRLALQVLVNPVLDCDFDTLSYVDPANQLQLTRAAMLRYWDEYAPDPAARPHPDVSPMQEPDLANLPPAVIATAEHDVLRDEGELYATRLRLYGGQVALRRFDGQIHGFFTMVGILPGSDAAMDFVAAEIEATLATADASGQQARDRLAPASGTS